MIKNAQVSLIVNTVEDKRNAIRDSRSIRTTAVQHRVTYYTTMAGARAACEGIPHVRDLKPYAVQELHRGLPGRSSQAREAPRAQTGKLA
jgi:carbamoyl-phosphate synthase large subunit